MLAAAAAFAAAGSIRMIWSALATIRSRRMLSTSIGVALTLDMRHSLFNASPLSHRAYESNQGSGNAPANGGAQRYLAAKAPTRAAVTKAARTGALRARIAP
jgi:hypothetical protein